jgi:ComF family protein
MKRSVNLLGDLVDLIFPALCPGCNEPFVSGETTLCTSCILDLPLQASKDELTRVFAGRMNIEEIAVFLKFYSGGITQRILHEIKYRKNLELARYVGRLFMQTGKNSLAFQEVDVIVPVPLHQTKLKKRGYNQSEIIGEGIAKELEKPLDDNGVIRKMKSDTQTRKSRAERWQNVAGIFEVIDDRYVDKHVLLVDDVLTTGATLEACGGVILEAGAKKLSIATLAMA